MLRNSSFAKILIRTIGNWANAKKFISQAVIEILQIFFFSIVRFPKTRWIVEEFFRYLCNFAQNCYLFIRKNLKSPKNSINFQQNVFFFPQIACVWWHEASQFFSTLSPFVGKFYRRVKFFQWSQIVAKLYLLDR